LERKGKTGVGSSRASTCLFWKLKPLTKPRKKSRQGVWEKGGLTDTTGERDWVKKKIPGRTLADREKKGEAACMKRWFLIDRPEGNNSEGQKVNDRGNKKSTQGIL